MCPLYDINNEFKISDIDYIWKKLIKLLPQYDVIHLTKQLATALAPEIRVNAIAPGLIADNEDMSPKKRNEVLEKTPLGRLATRKEIAEVLYSICGPSFDSVTGQTIIIDGGFNLGQ